MKESDDSAETERLAVHRSHQTCPDTFVGMGGIRIRDASASDAIAIASIHTASWRDAYANILDPAFLAGPLEQDRRSVWLDRLQRPDAQRTILLAETVQGAMLGFGCVYFDIDPTWGSWIDNLHVAPPLRGKYVGRRIMNALARRVETQAEAAQMHLWVFEANTAALRFYIRLGGTVVERRSSGIPAAKHAPILRVFWSQTSILAASESHGPSPAAT